MLSLLRLPWARRAASCVEALPGLRGVVSLRAVPASRSLAELAAQQVDQPPARGSDSASAAPAKRSVTVVKRFIPTSTTKLLPVVNLVGAPSLPCFQIAGMSVPNALRQMEFTNKLNAALVLKTVNNASNLADIRYRIPPERLVVSVAMVNRGPQSKRARIAGRGRVGVQLKKHAHLTIRVEEGEQNLTERQRKVNELRDRFREEIRQRRTAKPTAEIKFE